MGRRMARLPFRRMGRWCCWIRLGSWRRCIDWRTGRLLAARWWSRAGTIFWSRRRLGRFRCLVRRWKILRRWRHDLFRRRRRCRWRVRKMRAWRGLSCCAIRSALVVWVRRRRDWGTRVAGRRRGRWRRLPNIWGGRRDADSAGTGSGVVAAVGGVRMGGAREKLDVRRGVVEGEETEGDGDQRRKFDDGRDGEDADGVVAGCAIFGGRQERGDFEPRLQGEGRNERRD